MEKIIEIIISNGIFACLFVWLLFYILKDSSSREKRYIDIIEKLSTQLEVIEDVKEDVKEIKESIKANMKKVQNETTAKNI